LNILGCRNLKEWQKKEGHCHFLTSFSPEAEHKTLMWEVSSLHSEEGDILSLETKGHREELSTGLAMSPSLWLLDQIPHVQPYFSTIAFFIRTCIKIMQISPFLQAFFTWFTKNLCKINVYVFLLFICLLPWTQDESGKDVALPLPNGECCF
jgi:hypothetical protein